MRKHSEQNLNTEQELRTVTDRNTPFIIQKEELIDSQMRLLQFRKNKTGKSGTIRKEQCVDTVAAITGVMSAINTDLLKKEKDN